MVVIVEEPFPETKNEGELDFLIKKIENAKKLEGVRYKKCLLKSLRQLSSIEGMTELKNKIARQTSFLIFNPKFIKRSSPPMLNTILYGPPGVGKTKVAIILAKIWASLDILGKDVSFFEKQELQNGVKTEGQRNYFYLSMILLGVYIVYNLYLLIISSIKDSKKLEAVGVDTKPFRIANLIFLVLVVMILIGYFIFSKIRSSRNHLQKWENDEIEDISQSNVIDIISRDDLVSGYLGQTSLKTREVLTKSIGKVLFIDEAYSIVTSDHDPYGTEALTTINLFLSQHPGKVIVILAGYKDLIQNRVFSAQPGLPRRFMWHFSIDGYSPMELKGIFEKQLRLGGMKIRPPDGDKILSIFEREKEVFSNYGGDTERLVFYLEINKSFDGSDNFEEVSEMEIKKAIEDLKQNKKEETPLPESKEERIKRNYSEEMNLLFESITKNK